MKKVFIIAGILVIVFFSLYSGYRIYRTSKLSRTQDVTVLLVQNPFLTADSYHIIEAYKHVLDEEGVFYRVISDDVLVNLNFDDIAENIPVIIFPDSIAQSLSKNLKPLIKDYLLNGGNVAVIYDAGIKDSRGLFLKEAIFTDITGINYITYDKLRDNSYGTGYIRISEENSKFLQLPPGKRSKDYYVLGGYAYGNLKYPIAKNEIKQDIRNDEILADAITEQGEKFPAVVMRDYGKGRVLYVNLPLGYLKAYSDDLLIRMLLRTFLFKVLKIPHILNVRNGKGGLVINLHIDANSDWKSIPYMFKNKYFRKDIEYSMHITAGDFRDKPGDGLGFDACGKGRRLVKDILDYGVIGSHGGWAHNWFPEKIRKGEFKEEEIYAYIKKNTDCLESITGYKIVEYAAPNGVHPQPVTTKVLEKLGFLTYYYTGDSGSAPNRTFLNGKVVSENIFAFPIMPFGKYASFEEMKKAGKTEEEVEKWFIETLNYIVRNKTVRLIYSHPYDIPDYPNAFKSFLDYAGQLQEKEKLEVKPMSYFVKYLQRFLKTSYSFRKETNKLLVALKNPEGLEGITVAVPKKSYKRPDSDGIGIQEDEDYYYLSVKENIKEKNIYVDAL